MGIAEVSVEQKLRQEIIWLKQRISELQGKNSKLNLYADLIQCFVSNLDLQRNLDFLLEKVLQITEARRVGIALVDQQYPSNTYFITKGLQTSGEKFYLSSEEPSLINYIMEKGQSVALRELTELPKQLESMAKYLPYLGLPLKINKDLEGVFFVENFLFPQMAEDHLSFLNLLTVPVALAIRNNHFLQQLRQQEEKFNHNLAVTYQEVIEIVEEGVLAIDKNGIINLFNREMEEILGIEAKNFIGKEFTQAFSWLDSRYWHLIDTLQGQNFKNLEYSFSCQGKEVNVRVKARPIKSANGEVIGGITCWQDISQETKMYQEMAQIGHLAMLGQLVATVTHEIRNPLSAIRGLAQLIQIIPDSKEKERKIEIVIKEVDHLNKIVEDWVCLSKSSTENHQFTEVDLVQLIQDLTRLLQGKMVMTEVEVISHFAPNLPNIIGNYTLLKQAILNLLINSLQAMPQGGDIYIQGEYLEESQQVRLVIHDTGIGISEENLEKIFRPFFTNKETGTGLGLAVVRQVIVEKHKGKIWFDSKENKGTTVFIELPIK